MAEYSYNIYAKKTCLYKDIPENEFNHTWTMLKGMVGLMKTDYNEEDLTYEKILLDKD
jgi:hypothetical protein|tara:strand:- start:2359 stop:2532 length:174 start_codon:yes stop_codon:yes gene_type:complete